MVEVHAVVLLQILVAELVAHSPMRHNVGCQFDQVVECLRKGHSVYSTNQFSTFWELETSTNQSTNNNIHTTRTPALVEENVA